jgi:hypothetical protein
MAVILYFVFRSLAKHLRKINEAARLEAMSSGTGGAAESPGSAPAAATTVSEPKNPLMQSDYERQ